MILSVDFDSADFDLRWPAAMANEPVITVYDGSGVVVQNVTIDRPSTPLGGVIEASVSVMSPVPIGRIKVGPIGGIMYIDNVVYQPDQAKVMADEPGWGSTGESVEVRLGSAHDTASAIGRIAARLGVELMVSDSHSATSTIGDVAIPAGSPAWLVEAALLRAVRPRHILFLCVANSARSQLAEGLARSLSPGGVKISSAGSAPTSVRPQAIAVLDEVGIDISHHVSRSIDEVERSVDTVVTLCAEEVCPVWLGDARRLHWGLPDPADVGGTEEQRLNAFRSVRDELRTRLDIVFSGGSPK